MVKIVHGIAFTYTLAAAVEGAVGCFRLASAMGHKPSRRARGTRGGSDAVHLGVLSGSPGRPGPAGGAATNLFGRAGTLGHEGACRGRQRP